MCEKTNKMSFVFRTPSLNAANIVNRIGSFKQRDNKWFKKIAKIITVFHELQQSKDEHDWYQFGVKPSLGNHVKNRYTLNPNPVSYTHLTLPTILLV